jgi:TonB family protein
MTAMASAKSEQFGKAFDRVLEMFKRCGTVVDAPAVFTAKYLLAQDCTEKPVALKIVPPAYPEKLKEKKIEGAAFVEFLVGTDGVPFQVQATKATQRDFAEAAVASVACWRFKPGICHGKPVVVFLKVPLLFEL